MKKVFLIAVISLLLFTGCNSTEIDGRNFVSAVGVDKTAGGKFKITACYITPDGENMYSSEIKTIETYLPVLTDRVFASRERQLYFGHVKAIVLGKSVLDSENIKNIFLSASADSDISMDTVILASQTKGEDVIKNISDSGDGLYIWNFYKNNENNIYSSFKLTLAQAIKNMDIQKSLVIPSVYVDGEETAIEGGTAYNEYGEKGLLSPEELRGFLYLKGDGEGIMETFSMNNNSLLFTAKKEDSDFEFYEKDGVLCADVNIKAVFVPQRKCGYDEEYLKKKLSNCITDKAKAAVKKLKENNCDGMGICHMVMRRNNSIYKKYEGAKMFKNMEININTNIKIK